MNNTTTKYKKYLMLGVLSINNTNFAMQNGSNQSNKWKNLITAAKNTFKVAKSTVKEVYEIAPEVKKVIAETKNIKEVWNHREVAPSNRLPAIIEGAKNISKIHKGEETANKYKTENILKIKNKCDELGLFQQQYQEILNKMDEKDMDVVLKMDKEDIGVVLKMDKEDISVLLKMGKEEREAILGMNKEDRKEILHVLRDNN